MKLKEGGLRSKMELSQSRQSDKMTTAGNHPIAGQMDLIEYSDTLVSLVTHGGPSEVVGSCGATRHFSGQSQGYVAFFLCVLSQASRRGGHQALPGTGEDAE